jgi:hypothetical protein
MLFSPPSVGLTFLDAIDFLGQTGLDQPSSNLRLILYKRILICPGKLIERFEWNGRLLLGASTAREFEGIHRQARAQIELNVLHRLREKWCIFWW